MEQRPGERRDLIFVGVVEAIGPAPRAWSGHLCSYQEVVYRVEQTITGESPGRLIAVRHAVVRGSPTAEPGDAPALSASLFTPGARLVVMAVRDAFGPWFAPSEHFGAMRHSRLLEEQLRAAASAHESSGETVSLGGSNPPKAAPGCQEEQ
jgi:hypothetical protein